MKKQLYYILHMSLCCIIFAACGDDDEAIKPSASGGHKISLETRWELPARNSNNIFIVHSTSDGLVNYCLEYNTNANHSQWVAYRYDRDLAANNTSNNRTNAWNWDPALNNNKEHQSTTSTYPYPYQRGHLLGSAERYYSNEANAQTFYMTNMSPMINNFNGNDWGNGIEDIIRAWGRATGVGDTLYVVKGGTLDQTIGTINVSNTLGKTMQVAVPKYYFAACLKRLASGNIYAIGFWIEHKDHQLSGSNSQVKQQAYQLAKESACTIDELEERTGLDFFHNIPDQFENAVEARMSLSQWSW